MILAENFRIFFVIVFFSGVVYLGYVLSKVAADRTDHLQHALYECVLKYICRHSLKEEPRARRTLRSYNAIKNLGLFGAGVLLLLPVHNQVANVVGCINFD